MSTPVVSITQLGAVTALVAPCPVSLEAVSATTLGGGIWADAFVEWWVHDDPSGIIEEFTAPAYEMASDGSVVCSLKDGYTLGGHTTAESDGETDFEACLGLGIDKYNYGVLLKNVAGTATIKCRVTNANREVGYGSITIGSSGSPDISYSLRADAGYIQVDPASSAGGTGTAADPVRVQTVAAAFAALSGISQTIRIKRGETYSEGASSFSAGSFHNLVVEAYGTGARPIVLCDTFYSSSTANNCVTRGIHRRPTETLIGATKDAFDVPGHNWGLVDCFIEGTQGGTGFQNAITSTGRTALCCLGGEWQTLDAAGYGPKGDGHFFFGLKATDSRFEWIFRFLGDSGETGGDDTPCDYVAMHCMDITYSNWASFNKGAVRFQSVRYAALSGRVTGGDIELVHNRGGLAGGLETRHLRVDRLRYSGVPVVSTFGIKQRGHDTRVLNVLAELDTAGKQFIKKTYNSDATTDTSDNIHFAGCTVVLLAANVSIFNNDENNWVLTGNHLDGFLIAGTSGSYTTAKIYRANTTVDTLGRMRDWVVPAVSGSYDLAELDTVGFTATELNAKTSDPDVSGTLQLESYDPAGGFDESIQFRPQSGAAVTGFTRPSWLHVDIYGRRRGSTTYIGAVDAEPVPDADPTSGLGAILLGAA